MSEEREQARAVQENAEDDVSRLVASGFALVGLLASGVSTIPSEDVIGRAVKIGDGLLDRIRKTSRKAN
jgi:hypothetical protein